MNILDENIPASQRQRLENWRIRTRQIGLNVGRGGMQDDEIISSLRQLRRSTFFTRDDDFFDRQLCHARYCLVYLAVEMEEVAPFMRRVLNHPRFDTQAKRMGAVLRVSNAGISIWRLHIADEEIIGWK